MNELVKFIIGIIVINILGIAVHEFGHALAVIMSGNEFIGFGMTFEAFYCIWKSTSNTTLSDCRLIYSFGVISALVVFIPLMIVGYKNNNRTLYLGSVSVLLTNLFYWAFLLELYSDSFLFARTFKNYNNELHYIVFGISFIIMLVLFMITDTKLEKKIGLI